MKRAWCCKRARLAGPFFEPVGTVNYSAGWVMPVAFETVVKAFPRAEVPSEITHAATLAEVTFCPFCGTELATLTKEAE